ncbi:MAG: DNA cytosine methyltransferase, partial [Clostridiales bacterium]|nr:DNA cytosine methyltransferase [Clostridiales bacterium]
MKILCACEESQAVCKAFRAKGHEAYSCDIVMCSGNKPEWHIWSDVTPLLNGNCTFRTCDGQAHTVDRWDMIVAFPPCTYLSRAGSTNLYKHGELNQERYEQGVKAAEFFFKIYNADCDKICIENPVPIKRFGLPEPTQVVQPYYFGVPVTKMTYLWLKGLPFVCPTNVVDPQYTFNTYPLFKNSSGKYQQRNRSKTFKEFAEAMALS